MLTTSAVKPAKLSRTKINYLCGASIKTHFDQWKDNANTHGGIPSELIELPAPEIRVGKDDDGEYSEIVVPDDFEPGSILLFATDMDVSGASPTRLNVID
jgi:glycogen debranching enzyme